MAVMTKAERVKFLKERMSGLGGSDAAALMGENPWMSPMEVYVSKTQQPDPDDDDDLNPKMEWGNIHEANILKRYQHVTGIKVRRRSKQLRSAKHPFMVAHVDGLGLPDGLKKPDRVVEAKCVFSGRFKAAPSKYYEIPEEKRRLYWGDSGTDQVPYHYLLQAMHYMIVTGLRLCDFAVLFEGWDFRVYHLQYDERLATTMIALEEQFWNDYVIEREPPPPDKSESCQKAIDALNRSKEKKGVLDFESLPQEQQQAMIKMIEDDLTYKEDIKSLNDERKENQAALKLALGGHSEVNLPDGSRAVYSGGTPAQIINWHRVLQDIHEDYGMSVSDLNDIVQDRTTRSLRPLQLRTYPPPKGGKDGDY